MYPARTARTMIRRELGLPEDAFIVLGCGTLDLRKGIDHYAAIARRVTDTNNTPPADSLRLGWRRSTLDAFALPLRATRFG